MISNYKAVIIDDEEDGRMVLSKLLTQFAPEISIVGEAHNIITAYQIITNTKPDVIFLDIQMPGGNGFQLLKKIEKIDFEIIFVTSYDSYAIEAVRLSALDYLLKPVEVEDLKNSINRLKERKLQSGAKEIQIKNALDNYEGTELTKKIAIHTNDYVRLVSLNEITHFEGEGNYTSIFLISGERHVAAKTMANYEEMLESSKNFFRISKSCICNLNFVTHYSKSEPCMVSINNKYSFEVSRRKKQELLTVIKLKLK